MGNLSFITPLALWGLLALPVLWWLLRATPPRPQSIKFPPLRILLTLQSKEETPDKTPWWVLLLRLVMAALLIFAVAHPMLNRGTITNQTSGPLLLIIDDGWAAAKSWPKRQETLTNILNEARAANRIVTVATTTPNSPPLTLKAMSAGDAQNFVRAMAPQALNTDRLNLLLRLTTQRPEAAQVIWLSDGLDASSSGSFATGLTKLYGSTLTAFTLDNADLPIALSKPTIDGTDIKITALRSPNASNTAILQASAGDGRVLADMPLDFAGKNSVSTKINLPVELRNEIQKISIADDHQAGATQLLDDRWRRKTIAIQTGTSQEAAQPLLSPLHYVTNALTPFADVHEPATNDDLKAELDAGLSMLVLADIGKVTKETSDLLRPWIEKGGVLLRFAGPRLAASTDDLLPVTLREGDRNLGNALSWETPQVLQAFSDKSPFAGIEIDPRITVSRQVLAEPDASLAEKTWSSLADGTPLVTAAKQGKGLIILFHITANPDWSNLPLSGTFVEMLQHIVALAPAAGSNGAASASEANEADFAPRLILSGAGELISPTTTIQSIPTIKFELASASPQTPAGLYMRGGQERAINLNLAEADIAPITAVPLQKPVAPETTALAPQLFMAAAALFLLDCLAALFLAGAFTRRPQNSIATVLIAFIILAMPFAPKAKADDQSDMAASLETHLAYVKTGNNEIDQTSELGLKGLGLVMDDRTSAALGDPIGINIETDNLVFYPLLYWPVTENDQAPSDAALNKLDSFMKNGGTIFFDLRNSGGDFGSGSASGDALKRILANLDIPPLEPVPENHVLTRSFYLLKKFPGRYEGGPLWVETQDANAAANNSDGVSGVIIGSNDYAAAWALNDKGEPMNAMIPGSDRQREMAFRVGVNIVMYALTGNYKTDQVHIPALLERLGQ